MPEPLLIDVSCQCPEHTDATLEFIYKAAGDDIGDAIWDEHPSPLIRRVVELFTSRGLTRTEALRGELGAWLAGKHHRASMERLARPDGAMARWTATELGVVKLYLETLPPAAYTIEDYGLLVDYLVQRWLPAADLRADAEWLTSRSNIMGKIEASLGRDPSERDADAILAALPGPVGVAAAFGFTAAQNAALDYGRARCADNVVAWSDAGRLRLRRVIMDYAEAKALGDSARAAGALETRLFDEFGTMNRDWRRIAVTESGENLNQGLVASVPIGTRLRRVEKYRGACAFCRSIHDRVVTVVAPNAEKKDGANQVWIGKTNIGRSAAPRRRVGSELVPREPHEMWWIPAGTVHPHCRGMWVILQESTRPVDAKFSAWMDEVLKRKVS